MKDQSGAAEDGNELFNQHQASGEGVGAPFLESAAFTRPRLLFASIFIWLSATGGRFLAPFLESEAGMSSEAIGFCLAVQSAIVTLGGSFVMGPLADQREARYPGRGRAELVFLSVLCGSIFALSHGLPRIFSVLDSVSFHFALRIGYACSISSIFPVLDGITIQYLESHPEMSKEDYGRERLFGAVSWAIAHLIYGVLIDWVGFGVTYFLGFCASLITLGSVCVFALAQIRNTKRLEKRKSDITQNDTDPLSNEGSSSTVPPSDKEETTMFSRIQRILELFFGTFYSTAFMMCLFLLSFGQATVDSLVFLFFETLDSSYSMMGATVILTVAFEIPIFHIAPQLLEKSDAGVLLLTACVAYIVRVLGYAAIPRGHAAWVLLFEPLHGVTYATAQTSAVDTAAKCSPKGWEATGQGLISLIKGSGSFFGLLYGGWAVDHLGGRKMYHSTAALVSLGAAIFAFARFHPSLGGTSQQYLGVQQQESAAGGSGDEEEERSAEQELRSGSGEKEVELSSLST